MNHEEYEARSLRSSATFFNTDWVHELDEQHILDISLLDFMNFMNEKGFGHSLREDIYNFWESLSCREVRITKNKKNQGDTICPKERVRMTVIHGREYWKDYTNTVIRETSDTDSAASRKMIELMRQDCNSLRNTTLFLRDFF